MQVCSALVNTPEFAVCDPYANDEAACTAMAECTFSAGTSLPLGELTLNLPSSCAYTSTSYAEYCVEFEDGLLNKACSNEPNCSWNGDLCVGITLIEETCETSDPEDGCVVGATVAPRGAASMARAGADR